MRLRKGMRDGRPRLRMDIGAILVAPLGIGIVRVPSTV